MTSALARVCEHSSSGRDEQILPSVAVEVCGGDAADDLAATGRPRKAREWYAVARERPHLALVRSVPGSLDDVETAWQLVAGEASAVLDALRDMEVTSDAAPRTASLAAVSALPRSAG